jgi:hypothetical protein
VGQHRNDDVAGACGTKCASGVAGRCTRREHVVHKEHGLPRDVRNGACDERVTDVVTARTWRLLGLMGRPIFRNLSFETTNIS